MLKHAHILLGTVFVLLAICFCIWAVTLSPTYQKCEADRSAEISQEKPNHFEYRVATIVICEGVFANENGSAIAGLATIALVISTIGLWAVTGKAAEAAKVAAETIPTLERPFVLISKMRGVLTPPSRGEPTTPAVQIVFRNYGRTPANMETCVVFVRILDHLPTETDEASLPEGESTEVILGTDVESREWILPSMGSTDKLGISQHMKMQMNQQWLFCWGYIIYRDIFGNKHPTHFCRRFNLARQEFEPVGGTERNYGK